MAETQTLGEIAYAAYWQVQRTDGHLHYPPPFAKLPALTRQAWDAAAQGVRASLWQQAMPLLYVVVMQEGTQIQLCGAYPSADEAGIHLAHARMIMPDRHLEIRVCPFALTGQAHRQEDTPHA